MYYAALVIFYSDVVILCSLILEFGNDKQYLTVVSPDLYTDTAKSARIMANGAIDALLRLICDSIQFLVDDRRRQEGSDNGGNAASDYLLTWPLSLVRKHKRSNEHQREICNAALKEMNSTLGCLRLNYVDGLLDDLRAIL